MALEGSIKDFSLADIFQLIGIQRKTGILTLRSKDEEVKVSFLNGMVVNADSRSRRLDDRLGTVLTKTGKLTEDGLKQGLRLQKETLKKLGHVLVEENLVRPEDLREALGIQITQIIYRLFRWKDGDYHFEQDVAIDYDKDNFTPMSAESILMEGMRMIDEWPIIERKIPSFQMIFERVALEGGGAVVVEEGGGEEEAGEKSDDFDLIFGGEKRKRKKAAEPEESGRIRLSREENIVYKQVNGKATVHEIVERTMLSEFETCRALFDLLNRNLIAPQAAKARTVTGTKKRGLDLGRHLAVVLGVAASVLLVLGMSAWRLNPLNLIRPPTLSSPVIDHLLGEVSRERVARIAAAVNTYRLLSGDRPPAGLAELQAAGLLRQADLVDPWGRPMGFEVHQDGIHLWGRLGPEDAAPREQVKLEF